MLTQETASAMYFCQQNIMNAEKLLADMAEIEKKQKDSFPERVLYLKDVFGRQQPKLELGVPSGSSGHRIFNVEYGLAKIIIEAQIKSYQTTLAALNELAAKECLSSVNAQQHMPVIRPITFEEGNGQFFNAGEKESMTKCTVLDHDTPNEAGKPIEFVGLFIPRMGSCVEPKTKTNAWKNIRLIQRDPTCDMDIMIAFDDDINTGCIYLGHWNDGFVN